ncbi:L-threonylcarbamoyladenylate synthase [Candidatus Mesenet endosymbiont of Agriotes lineatus]|uniref:L-threonylcarbamoyladenylate synthase n=1 Tax=Candidatus Mesenet endosymbiont of Agriotes lineatus TaxID=3077948 RepID=UPI0030D5322C
MLNVINALNNGKLICFPTETVYALSCNANDASAIDKIYKIKKRNKDKPLSVFVANIDQLKDIAIVKENYLAPIKYFSPGPITFILPLKENSRLPKEFFQSTIGIRIPNHPIALKILNEFKNVVVATSINISGEKSVSRACDIPGDIKKEASIIIEDDKLVMGVESTIVDLTTDEISVLRRGKVTEENVKTVFDKYGKYNRT